VRTVADVRHILTHGGGNLGTDGSVDYQFQHVGQLFFAPGTSEDKVLEAALEAGANDVVSDDDGSIEVITDPGAFESVKKALEAAGLNAEMAEITMRPNATIDLAAGDASRMQQLVDALEELDDVQAVYHNANLNLE
jgi:transcriptional/translational regulatory protein YebC/TACO1